MNRLMIFGFVSLLFISCEKSKGIVNNESLNGNNSYLCDVPNNLLNVLDSVGELHNMNLELIMNQVSTNGDNLAYEANALAKAWTLYRYGESYLPYIYSVNEIDDLLLEIEDTMISFVNQLELSIISKGYVKDVFVVLLDTINVNQYCDVKNKILLIENSIIQDTNIMTSEKEILLAFTSIGRHSYYYWFNHFELNEDGYELYNGNEESRVRRWFKAGAAAIGDAACGIASGAAANKNTDPNVANRDVIIGAASITGAVSASATAAGLVDRVFDWFSRK